MSNLTLLINYWAAYLSFIIILIIILNKYGKKNL